MGAASFWHAAYQGAGWLGVAYLVLVTVILVSLAYRRQREGEPFNALVVLLAAAVLGFADFGWILSVNESDARLEGAIVGGTGYAFAAAWVAGDVVERVRATHKLCPDCCETVKNGARVCKFCGYRFSPPAMLG